jgi:hypothetical protein
MNLLPTIPRISQFVSLALAGLVAINNINGVSVSSGGCCQGQSSLGILLPNCKPHPLHSRANEEPPGRDVLPNRCRILEFLYTVKVIVLVLSADEEFSHPYCSLLEELLLN